MIEREWLQKLCIIGSILGEKQPHLCSGLFRHLDIILEVYRNSGGTAWFQYDESYRQKLSVHPSVKEVGLWLNLMWPQRNTNRPASNHLFSAKGVCFAFNDVQCKFAANRRYGHECAPCAGSHPASKCFTKSQNSGNAKETVSKGADASESTKIFTMARAISRQSES